MQTDHATIEQLSALLDDQLAEAEAAEVRRHIASCEACGDELESLRATVLLLNRAPAIAPPRSFLLPGGGQARKMDRSRLPGWLWPSAGALRALAGAAAALMLVLIVADIVQPLSSSGGAAALSRAPAAYTASVEPTSSADPRTAPAADQAGNQAELRAAAPAAAGQASSETAPALRSAPAPRVSEGQPAQPPARDGSAGTSEPVNRAQPAGQAGSSEPGASIRAPAPGGTPPPAAPPAGRWAIVALAGLALVLFAASFVVRPRV